ncbi:hypothetical protein [Legionella jordanis]|uniref:Uncharacterized protein n=1 Tax=Legionella jordanis TaxID=456 RepID=A0A0W0VAV8_9GAMM|nr:hypothetical protein [Legionella jordanis]KTD17262.1 hypothetical protein Ljor_1568 [Legionella jordanis]RMX03375.1 hypothetical protein EAW55_08150 [Legionella jordanis]VEH12541.1 Uncharacterised protein [Legionella jordanis]
MTFYLYVPTKQSEMPQKESEALQIWIEAEAQKGRQVKVTYYGQKGLMDIPDHSKIYLFMHGTNVSANPLVSQINDPELVSSFPSLSGFLKVSDGKNEIKITDVADRMKEDGLFFKPRNYLRIKLFQCDPINKARIIAEAFFIRLKRIGGDVVNASNIRIDYYPAHFVGVAQENNRIHHKYATKGIVKNFDVRASSIRNSLYTDPASSPGLTLAQVNDIISEYYQYKSARACGLSGLLGLNGLFSSDASAHTIAALQNPSISDQKRFEIGSRFIKCFAHNQLARSLEPAVTEAKRENLKMWAEPQACMADEYPNLQIHAV